MTRPSELENLIIDEEDTFIQFSSNEKPNTSTSKWLPWQVVFATFTATLGSMTIGNVISFTSPLLPQLKADNSHCAFTIHLSTEEESWVAGLVPAIAIIGGLIGGFITDYFGRKLTLMLASLPMTLGWLIITGSFNANLLYIGRGMTGLSSGILLVAVPIYVAETSPADRRGILLSFHALWLHIGTLWSYVIGAFLSWKWLATINISACLLMILCLTLVPETPRWLKLQGHHSEAKISLTWLRGNCNHFNINTELEEIEESLTNCDKMATVKDFKDRSLYIPLFYTLALMFFQILAGIDVIWFYTVTVFQTAGSQLDPYMQTIIIGMVGVLGSVVSTMFMDCYGRRPMLVVSGIIMTVCMIVLGAYFKMDSSTARIYYWLPLVCVMCYLLGFDFAWGPIPNAMVGELLPSRARGVASSVTVAWAWFLIFVVTKGYVNLKDIIHEYGAFWFFGGISLAGIIFVLTILPETKGKTLEQIETHFK